jgi:hypothetical protein
MSFIFIIFYFLRVSELIHFMQLIAVKVLVLFALNKIVHVVCEEHRLKVLENRVLMRMFGPKRDEVTGEWRRLHNKELYAVYSSPNIIRVINSRRMRWTGHLARMDERRGA